MKIKSLLTQLFSLCLVLGVTTSAQADISSKIIGGTIAPANEYPSTVAILFKNNFDLIVAGNAVNGSTPVPATSAHFQSQFCAGTLVDAQWVLTAAHCMIDFVPGELLILEGTQTLAITDNDSDNANAIPVSALPGNRIIVTDIIRHPGYDLATFDSDLALLKLSAPATQTPVNIFNGSLAATAISSSATACTNADNCASIVGWGTDDAVNGSTFPEDLLEAEVPLVSNTSCDIDLGGGITANMLCAGFVLGGKDTCQGDSGGPLYMSISGNPSAADYALAGITSFGNGCADPNSPGAYTRVINFQSYIDAFTSGNTPATDVPVITPPNSLAFTVSTQINLPTAIVSLDAVDGDNDILTWSIGEVTDDNGDDVTAAGNFSIDINGNVSLVSVPNPISPEYEILVKVTDNEDGSDFQRLDISLDNLALVADASMTQLSSSKDGPNILTLVFSLYDSNGNALTSGGSVVEIDDLSASVEVSDTLDNGDGTYTITLSVPTCSRYADMIEFRVLVDGAPSGYFGGYQLGEYDPGDPNSRCAPSDTGGGGSIDWFLLPLIGLALRRRQ